jgi:hypothetical protein
MKNLSVSLKFGLLIAAGLIAYFLLLALFGLHINPFYSLFNPVIVGVGMFAAINHYKNKKGNKYKDQKGVTTALVTGFIATIIFTVFFAFYATEIDPDFIENLLTMWESDWYINIGMVIATVALMGFSTSIVSALACLQLFKRTWNTKEGREHTL